MNDGSGGSGPGERRRVPAVQVTLPPVLGSVPRARHWVAAFLSGASDELRQTAALLTSELVTNAVLHTSTDVTVTAEVADDGVRVEVADGSTELPTVKDYGADAATGRGLTVLDSLADQWGTRIDDLGKVVWFELGAGSVARDAPRPSVVGPSPAPRTDASPDDLMAMSLAGVPVALLVRAQAAYEELFREFRLVLERDPARSRGAIQQRLIDLVDELGTRFSGFTSGAEETWRDAVARAADTVDLHYTLPRAVGPLCRHYDALLDEAEDFCRAAALLTLAPPHDVVALRKWVLGEFVRQVNGSPPQSFGDSTWAADVGQGV